MVLVEVPRRRQILVGLPALLIGAGATAACDAPRPGLVPERGPRGPRRSARTAPVDRDPVGALDDVDPAARWAFAEDGFAPLPEAGPGDWLHAHAESPQSFATFTIEGPNRPTAERRTLLVARLGWGDAARAIAPSTTPTMAEIVAYLGAFFTLPVATIDVQLDRAALEPRTQDGREQLRTTAILDALEPQVPDHAYAMLAVTPDDLYPGPEWNFVFGMARLHRRVGVFSLARYGEGDAAVQRGLAVLSHEAGHMFGISHCVHYACLMNGFNSREELDRTPMHLCRVCLRKLHAVVGFDPGTRYRAVRERLVAAGVREEVTWIDGRLAGVRG